MQVDFYNTLIDSVTVKALKADALIAHALRADLMADEGRALADEIGARYSALVRAGLTAGLDEALENARAAGGLV